MTNLWNQKDVPHLGWIFLCMEDLEDLSGRCEFCGTALRYEHVHTHPDYPGEHVAGCCCATQLTRAYGDPTQRQGRFIAKVKARAGWLDRAGWKFSAKGNRYIKARGVHIVIHAAPDGWTYRIDGVKATKTWPSKLEARRESFNVWWTAVELNAELDREEAREAAEAAAARAKVNEATSKILTDAGPQADGEIDWDIFTRLVGTRTAQIASAVTAV